MILLGKRIIGSATFSFDYFSNSGFVGCRCSNCNNEFKINIEIYKSGILVEELDLNPSFHLVVEKLLNLKIIKENDNNKVWNVYSKYVLWNLDARYDIISCNNCANEYITIYGMGELQPGREELQFNGVFELIKT